MTYPYEQREKIIGFICEGLAEGKSLNQLYREDVSVGFLPDKMTLWSWLDRHPEFLAQYTRAREMQADALFDEALAIARTPQMGEERKLVAQQEVAREGDDEVEGELLNLREVEVKQGDMLGHRRLLIDTIKWKVGKLSPKKYGDRLDVNVRKDLSDLTPEEKYTEALQLARQLGMPEPPRSIFGLPELVELR